MFRIPNLEYNHGVITYPAGSNETALLSRGSEASNGRGFTDVRVIHEVHSNTTSTRPAKRRGRSGPPPCSSRIRAPVPVALSLVFMVRRTSLEQKLVDTSTAGNHPTVALELAETVFFAPLGRCCPRGSRWWRSCQTYVRVHHGHRLSPANQGW